MGTSTCMIYIHRDGDADEDIEVEVIGDVKIVDQGIGPYEYWGFKGYHHDYQPEVQSVSYDKTLYSTEEQVLIDAYLCENEEQIDTMLCENFRDDE